MAGGRRGGRLKKVGMPAEVDSGDFCKAPSISERKSEGIYCVCVCVCLCVRETRPRVSQRGKQRDSKVELFIQGSIR